MSLAPNPSTSSVSTAYLSNIPTQNVINSQNMQVSTGGATSISFMDDLVKEYLIFRGCNATLKSFEHDIKQDKDRLFKADKIVEQLFAYINSYDLLALLEYWSYLDQKYFSHITLKTSTGTSLSRKYELNLFRIYLIHSVQTNRIDKVNEFLEKLAPLLQSQAEWKDWFCLPFIKNPEEISTFSIYFNSKWVETFTISLQNFFNIVFQSVQFPRLLTYDEDAFWNTNVNQQKTGQNVLSIQQNFENDFLNQELTDEFQLMQTETSNTGSTFISILKNFGSSTSKSKSTANLSALQNLNNPNNTQQNTQKSVQKSPIEALFKATKQSSQNSLKTSSLEPKNLSTILAEESVSTTNTLDSIPDLTFTSSEQTIKTAEKDDSPLKTDEQKAPKQVSSISAISTTSSGPYLILGHDDYIEHKSAIVHCKYSIDGKHIASVDINGVVKIWSINQTITTINTFMQKSSILSMEWDKRNSKVLYLGSKSATIKIYDVSEKKVIQEMNMNKLYPRVVQICSFPTNDKIVVILATQTIKLKTEYIRNGQLVLCSINSQTNAINVEKSIDLEGCYSGCVIPCQNNYALLGCSDGYIRVFDFNVNEIVLSQKCHENNILNMKLNKSQTKLFSLGGDNQIKMWLLNATFFQSSTSGIQSALNSFKIPDVHIPLGNFDVYSSITANTSPGNSANTNTPLSHGRTNSTNSYDFHKTFTCLGTLMSLDTTDNTVFLSSKNGIILYKLPTGLRLETNKETNLVQPIDCNELERIELFECDNVTTIDLWNATHSCILLAGCLDGRIRIFKLLYQ